MTVKLPDPSPSPRLTDHIFVSYSSKDRAFVDRLAQDLRNKGHIAWIDFEGIRGGEQWKQSIADALHPSRVVLFVASPESVVSEWVEEEIKTARDLNKTIIPLLLRPVETAKITHPNIQFVLAEIHYRDFTKGYERPFTELLKDLPKPKSGVLGHCQKLAAKLAALPWGLDHYIQEEAKLVPLNASPYDDPNSQIENLLNHLRTHQRVIVLGEPGSGKSVALERLAWELATQDPPILPVIVKLLEYDGQPLLDWVRLRLVEHGEIKLKNLDETRTFLEELEFPCYILLDGLNEVRPAYREQIVGEITRLALEFPRVNQVITSRVQDESWRVLRQGSAVSDTLLVRPIRHEQIQTYLRAHLGEADGDKLWTQLDTRMRELSATPLLLWLLKEAWLEARIQRPGAIIKMPENRGELYQNFVNRMLRRDDERRLNMLPVKDRIAALERLALTLHEEQALTISRENALKIVGQDEFLSALLTNGLLSGEDELRFAPHQTLQEHFAARALLDGVMQKVKAAGIARFAQRFGMGRGVLEKAADSWWAETFIQVAGLTDDPNALAQTLAEINPWLAWWCVQEGRKVDEKTRKAIEAKSAAMIESPTVAVRRRALGALAQLQTARAIEPLARLSFDDEREICRTALKTLLAFGDAGKEAFNDRFEREIVRKKPPERAEWGRSIADYDPRPGIGLRPDGLPDIGWCDIPPGIYKIGGDPHAYQSLPAQEFELTYAFKMAKYPITYKQFQAFLDSGDYHNDRWWQTFPDHVDKQPDDQTFKYTNHPRDSVSWYQAVAFTRWLTASYRQVFAGARHASPLPDEWEIRLPTEIEWEIAARYPDGRKFPWGYEYVSGYANINEIASEVGIYYLESTTAVGLYPEGRNPNNAVFDLSGNVWEWCLNTFDNHQYFYINNKGRVLRGGSWLDYDLGARAASRLSYYPFGRNHYNGFRVVAAPIRSEL